MIEYMVKMKNRLEKARIALKKKFVGIDEIIDEIIDLVEPWYLLGNTNDRPTVICLWGMTGVGKTALVKELVSLLHKNMDYVRYDMGEITSTSSAFWFKMNMLDELADIDGDNAILCFDEMQLGRTILPGGMEISPDYTRPLWELIDTGIITSNDRHGSPYSELFKLNHLLNMCVRKGVKVSNGVVTQQIELFKRITEGYNYKEPFRATAFDDEDEPVLFVPDEYYSDILTAMPWKFGSEYELINYLKTLDGLKTKDIINEAMIWARAPQKINLSNALIFLVGNIDEIYPNANVLSPDMNADQYYAETLKITVPEVKQALQERFRNEQIARFGNNHIIYPSLNSKAYEQILEMELNKVASFFRKKYKLGLQFTKATKIMILKESVYPLQGARPLLTSMKSLVDPFTSKILNEILLHHTETKKIVWDYEEGTYIITLINEQNKKSHLLRYPVRAKGEDAAKRVSNSMKSLISLHESAHALIAALRTRILPDEIKLAFANHNNKGYVIHNMPDTIHSKRSLSDKIAISLSGICAEQMIFGNDNMSAGSKSDIQNATSYASSMIKELGFGKELNSVTVPSLCTNDSIFTNQQHEKQIKDIIKKIREEVDTLLMNEKKSLFMITKALTDKERICKIELRKILMENSPQEWVQKGEFIHAESYFNYDQVVKATTEKLQTA